VIEAIRILKARFLGVQWHPENFFRTGSSRCSGFEAARKFEI
jgi:gamma-glutamyl-gamma-aminobutyrate hydrolase PuuD